MDLEGIDGDPEKNYEIYESFENEINKELQKRRLKEAKSRNSETIQVRFIGNPYMFYRHFKPLACIPAGGIDDPFLKIGIEPFLRYASLVFAKISDKSELRLIEFRGTEFEIFSDFAQAKELRLGSNDAPWFEVELLSDWEKTKVKSAKIGFPRPIGKSVPFSKEEMDIIKEAGGWEKMSKLFKEVFHEMPVNDMAQWISLNPDAIEKYNDECKKLMQEREHVR